jgi:hypothetical protein
LEAVRGESRSLGKQGKRGSKLHSRRSCGSLCGALCGGNGECVSLSFSAPAPGHLLQRLEKVNELPIRKRTEVPGVIGANKASAIRNQAVHGFSDGRMKVSAGINAVVLGKTGSVPDL